MPQYRKPLEGGISLAGSFSQSPIFFMVVLTCLLLVLSHSSVAGTPRIISFDPPGSIWTIVSDINATGTAVGYFEDAVEQDHGFIRSPSGAITV
jgi:hypothetical protein